MPKKYPSDEKMPEYRQRWAEKNPAFQREYYRRNREKIIARSAARYVAKRDLILEQIKVRYAADPDRRKPYERQYRTENADRIRERNALWHAANRKKQAAMRLAWARRNPDSIRASRDRRRARKAAVGGSYTATDIAELYALQKGRCAMCRKLVGKRYHVDHIMPLAEGGSNHRRNLQILCVRCNCSKADKHPLIFARQRGFLL